MTLVLRINNVQLSIIVIVLMHKQHYNRYYHRKNGFELYEYMKHAYHELGTSLEIFNEAALHCKDLLVQYYGKELPNDILHAAVGMWFFLKLQHIESKIIHLAATAVIVDIAIFQKYQEEYIILSTLIGINIFIGNTNTCNY